MNLGIMLAVALSGMSLVTTNMMHECLSAEVIEESYDYYEVNVDSSMKSYMGYKVFSSQSKQYKLQQLCVTDEETGCRMYDGRYTVAIGTRFGADIGDYIDLVLEDGTVIPAIMGDAKAIQHTDSTNTYTLSNKCCSEFIVQVDKINSECRRQGNMSFMPDMNWNQRVVGIKVYQTNVLEENYET